jgi:hypothetical protein
MTGAQDYQRKIKMAICGYPGAGKTLFTSTGPQPFFVFFRDQPRIMSIADRYIPHAKVINRLDSSGRLETPVWETLLEVIEYLESERGKEYATVGIDTGDELFQALKEGRKAANRGKFAIQDWGWLGDTYREIVNRIIDLPKNVVVGFHLKNTQEGDDGEIVREIALQGQAKDEVAGWFDIVGVLDSWEEETQDGKILHRGMLTHTTPKYPFVKDHSGKLPKVFELSKNFVGDFQRLHDLIYKDLPKSDHEVLETVVPEPKPAKGKKTSVETGVPTPDDIAKKKGAKSADPETDDPGDESKDAAGKGGKAEGKGGKAADRAEKEPAEAGDDPQSPQAEEPSSEAGGGAEPEDRQADEKDGEATLEEATAIVEEELGATEVFVDGVATCEFEVDGEPCGKPLIKKKVDEMGDPVADENGEVIMVPDSDLMDLTKIRFRKHMCREHFTAARKG